MRRFGSFVAVLATVVGLSTVAGPAQADDRPCMSNAEYSRIHRGVGWSPARVARIVGSRGRVSWEDRHTDASGTLIMRTREWHRCGLASWHRATVDFETPDIGYRWGYRLLVTGKSRW